MVPRRDRGGIIVRRICAWSFAVLLVGALPFALTACIGPMLSAFPDSVAHGAGGASLADTMLAAVPPEQGEFVYKPYPDKRADYLIDDFRAAADADPRLRFRVVQSDTGSEGNTLTLEFADGSTLIVRESGDSATLNAASARASSPNGTDGALRVESVSVRR
jgi:hypothetical protein